MKELLLGQDADGGESRQDDGNIHMDEPSMIASVAVQKESKSKKRRDATNITLSGRDPPPPLSINATKDCEKQRRKKPREKKQSKETSVMPSSSSSSTTTLKSSLHAAQSECQTLKEQNTLLEIECDRKEHKIDALLAEIISLKKRHEKDAKELKELRKGGSTTVTITADETTNGHNSDRLTRQQSTSPTKAKTFSIRNDSPDALTELNALKSKMELDAQIVEDQEMQIHRLQADLEASQSEAKDAELQLEHIKQSFNLLQQNAKDSNDTIVHVRKVATILQDEIRSKDGELRKLRTRLKAVEEEKQALRDKLSKKNRNTEEQLRQFNKEIQRQRETMSSFIQMLPDQFATPTQAPTYMPPVGASSFPQQQHPTTSHVPFQDRIEHAGQGVEPIIPPPSTHTTGTSNPTKNLTVDTYSADVEQILKDAKAKVASAKNAAKAAQSFHKNQEERNDILEQRNKVLEEKVALLKKVHEEKEIAQEEENDMLEQRNKILENEIGALEQSHQEKEIVQQRNEILEQQNRALQQEVESLQKARQEKEMIEHAHRNTLLEQKNMILEEELESLRNRNNEKQTIENTNTTLEEDMEAWRRNRQEKQAVDTSNHIAPGMDESGGSKSTGLGVITTHLNTNPKTIFVKDTSSFGVDTINSVASEAIQKEQESLRQELRDIQTELAGAILSRQKSNLGNAKQKATPSQVNDREQIAINPTPSSVSNVSFEKKPNEKKQHIDAMMTESRPWKKGQAENSGEENDSFDELGFPTAQLDKPLKSPYKLKLEELFKQKNDSFSEWENVI